MKGYAFVLWLAAVAACGGTVEDRRTQQSGASFEICQTRPAAADVTVEAIDAHMDHTCALLSPCGAVCWGNVDGRTYRPTPFWEAQALPLKQISVGNAHTCAVAVDGTLWCWGDDLPVGSVPTPDAHSLEPVLIARVPGASEEVSAAGWGSCARLSDGTVACWGNGLTPEPGPTVAAGIEHAVAMANGATHACAVSQTGDVRCWGQNALGTLGDGTWEDSRYDPQPVVGLSEPAIGVAAAQEVSCAIANSRDAYCWGYGEDGLLGNGTTMNMNVATKVTDLTGVVEMDAQTHTCATRTDGSLYCWGDGSFLPRDIDQNVLTPMRVEGLSNVRDVAVGFWFTCALTFDQEIYCWGAHDAIGIGASSWVYTPTRVDWRAALR
jgi:alpha-tubulin suppressor-like RCC1 family protein